MRSAHYGLMQIAVAEVYGSRQSDKSRSTFERVLHPINGVL